MVKWWCTKVVEQQSALQGPEHETLHAVTCAACQSMSQQRQTVAVARTHVHNMHKVHPLMYRLNCSAMREQSQQVFPDKSHFTQKPAFACLGSRRLP